MTRRIFTETISFLLIILFVYAAASKLLDYQKFTIQVGQSPLLTRFANVIPPIVIVSEILTSALLILPRFRSRGFLCAFFLMSSFSVYISVLLGFSDYVPCSCGGILENLGWAEHLIFNMVFALVSLVGVAFTYSSSNSGLHSTAYSAIRRKPAMMIAICFAMSIAVVLMLFIISGVGKEQRNNFLRNFVSTPDMVGTPLNTSPKSYYIAGGTSHTLYLANQVADFDLLVVNIANLDTQHVRLSVDGIALENLPSLKVTVDSPYVYVVNGILPIALRGNTHNWKAERYLHESAYFVESVPIGPGSLAIRSLSSITNEHVLGVETTNPPEVRLVPGLLEKQIDGIFCTDGMLHYSKALGCLVYVYFYRNQYLCMDTAMHLLYRGRTVDTVSRAKLKVSTISSDGMATLSSPPFTVNRSSCVSGKWLYVNSALMARNEDQQAFAVHSVIDVYDIEAGAYGFSFYVPRYKNNRMTGFRVFGDKLVARYKEVILVFDIDFDISRGKEFTGKTSLKATGWNHHLAGAGVSIENL